MGNMDGSSQAWEVIHDHSLVTIVGSITCEELNNHRLMMVLAKSPYFAKLTDN